MRNRNTVLASLGVVVTAGLAVFAGSFASAAVPANPEAPVGTFTESEIDHAWRTVTDNYPESLPKGVEFPGLAPAFFHPDDGEDWFFEEGLVDEIAARYWRCAWLDQEITSDEAGKRSASATASERLEPSEWKDLPGVEMDVDSYAEMIAGYAEAEGLSESVAEFQIDCGVYTGEESK